MSLPARVRIVEVGPRDGLQNEPSAIPLETKLQLLDELALAGLRSIEAGSFVNPKWVPQMADSAELFAQLQRHPGVCYSALTPNLQGAERALAAGADEWAVFAAASESFSQRNTNCSIAQSLDRFEGVIKLAADAGVPVRGYLSCVLGCPDEGAIAPTKVRDVAQALLDLGCYEISLGDTIGVGTAGSMRRLLDTLLATIATDRLAVHCHDTFGQALTNIYIALEAGIAAVDASVAGLGGCPYAPGASGNVATEDVVYLLEGLGIDCGVNLQRLHTAGLHICQTLGRAPNSRVSAALSARR